MMKRILMSAAALSLLAASAFAQGAMTTTTESTQWSSSPAPMPMPLPPPIVAVPVQPAPVYEMRTVVEPDSSSYSTRTVSHLDNGVARTDSTTEKYIGPDGSSRTVTRTVEQDER
jgi:hypothetical protein